MKKLIALMLFASFTGAIIAQQVAPQQTASAAKTATTAAPSGPAKPMSDKDKKKHHRHHHRHEHKKIDEAK